MTNTQMPDRETLKQLHNNPAKWKRASLYYNKNNKPVFLPKRSKYSWTINFANPLFILSLLLFIAIVILLFKILI